MISLNPVKLSERKSPRSHRIVVIHHSPWSDRRLPAGPSQSQPQIRVLTVGEKVFVKQADFLEGLHPKETRTAAGQQDLLGPAQYGWNSPPHRLPGHPVEGDTHAA